MSSDLKILEIAPFYRYFVKGLADATAARVARVDVLVPHNRLSELSHWLPSVGYVLHVRDFTARKLVDKTSKPQNLHVSLVDMVYTKADRYNTGVGDLLLGKVDSMIRRAGLQFDAVQARFTWPCGYAAVKVGKEYGVPSVILVGEAQEWLFEMEKSRNKLPVWSWQNASALVCNSEMGVPFFKNYNSRVISALGGFDPSLFYPTERSQARRALGLPQDGPIVLSLGELTERKGFRYLIDATSRALRIFPNLVCVIVGEGPNRRPLEAQISSLGLQKSILLWGSVPHEKVSNFFNAADVFVLPTLSEGNPNVMFESLACGTPFVGTSVGGVPEVITSEDFGLLVSPSDVEDLMAKMILALGKSWDRAKIQQYAQRFTWSRKAEIVLGLYQKLAERETIR